MRRPLLLWAVALWLFLLGAIDVWRSVTLLQTRTLLLQLGSSLSSLSSVLLILSWTLGGASLTVAAIGLWLRREWARHLARIAIVVHFAVFQVYIWSFVRTGLLWERRWSTLILAALAIAGTITLLTWARPRRWLGLGTTSQRSAST